MTSPTGNRLNYVVQMHFRGGISNNTMMYEGLLAGLRAAISLGIRKIIVKGDSQLVIKQVNKEYACPQMAPYVEEVWKLQRCFDNFRATYIPRGDNSVADELSLLASRREPVPAGVSSNHRYPSTESSQVRPLGRGLATYLPRQIRKPAQEIKTW